MNTYCENCGDPLIEPKTTQKYCKRCAIKIKKEQTKNWWMNIMQKPPNRCTICNEIIIPESRKRRYCDDCKKLEKKYRSGKLMCIDGKMKVTDKSKVDTTKCVDCIYHTYLGGIIACQYILVKNKMRNSEPSECDKFMAIQDNKEEYRRIVRKMRNTSACGKSDQKYDRSLDFCQGIL